jgi:hypothetical protein
MFLQAQPRDVWDIAEHVVLIVTVLSAVVGFFITRHDRVAESKKAMEQIDKVATNDMPHLTAETQQTNVHLTEQTKLLQSMDKNIALLVDRSSPAPVVVSVPRRRRKASE